MKIYTVVGARPNFIKIDPKLKQTIVHTGQHYDYEMSQTFFDQRKLPKPKYNLGCKKVGQMIDKLTKLFLENKPDIVVVFGDTNSSLAGALAAAYAKIPVAHIEAGVRSYDWEMPEEVNRVLIDRIAKVKLCPNQDAAINLMKEGIRKGIHVVGDASFDALNKFMPIKRTKDYKKYMLLTLHRDFNTDNKSRLRDIMKALDLSNERIIFPIHPRTKKMLRKFKIKIPKNIEVIPPQEYKSILSLISNCTKVITDSGGIQREGYWMQKPVIILRETTEWTEIIHKRGGVLVGADMRKVYDAVKDFKGRPITPPEFGANKKIRDTLYKYV